MAEESFYVGNGKTKGIMTVSKDPTESESKMVSYFSNDALEEQTEFQLYTSVDGSIKVNVSTSHSPHATIGVPLEVFKHILFEGEKLKITESMRGFDAERYCSKS